MPKIFSDTQHQRAVSTKTVNVRASLLKIMQVKVKTELQERGETGRCG
ncbi:MAG: hypothetical protein ACTS73_00060 [Arsenophonus sp. NEOnobi-MAG3]